METFTEFSRDGKIDIDLSEHLYVKRIQSSLNNLRFACDKLKQYKVVALTWCASVEER